MGIIDRVGAGPGYSHAVTVTGTLAFVSGQVPLDGEGNLVGPGDLEAQTRQAMHNLEGVLAQLGATWADVVKFGWYVTDVTEIQKVRDIRDEFIRPALGDRPSPASTLVQVVGMFNPEFLVEVEAVVAL